MQSHRQYRRWLNLYFVVTGVLLLAMAYFALRSYVQDSEFWSISLSKELFNFQTPQFSLYYKTPFYLLLHLISKLATDNVMAVILARAAFVVVAWLVVWQTYLIALLVLRRRLYAYISVILLMSVTYFSVHSVQVRSDILSCLFFLMIWRQLLGIGTAKANVLRIFSYSLMMMLVTPKAIYFALILGVYILAEKKLDPPLKKKLAANIFSPWAAVSLLLLISAFGLKSSVAESYTVALEFFKNNLAYGFNDLYPIFILIQNNMLFILLFVVSLIAGLRSNRDTTLKYMTLTALAAIALHNQRMQFFIAAFLPIFCIYVAAFLKSTIHRYKIKPTWCHALLFFALGKMIAAGVIIESRHSNELQLQTISAIEDYLKNYPEAEYFDVIGALPLREQKYTFFTPSDGDYDSRVQVVKNNEPDVVMYTARLFLVREKIEPFLQQNYVQVGEDFWAKKINASPIRTAEYKNQTYEVVRLIDAYIGTQRVTASPSFLYAYMHDAFNMSHNSPFWLYDTKTKKMEQLGSPFNITQYVDGLEKQNRKIDEYELWLVAGLQNLSVYAPFDTKKTPGGLKILFSYRSGF